MDVVGLSSGVKAIAATGLSTCALTNGGGVKCWGDNQWVQLGDGTSTNRSTPVDVVGLSSGVQAVTVAGHHTCALLDSGSVKCWGFNYGGEVGDGTSGVFRSMPVNVVGLSSGVSAVAAGGAHTCALLNSGGVKCWGWNNFNQLGDGTSTNRLTPVDVVGLSSSVHALGSNLGNNSTCVLMSNGGVKCWGLNDYNQLGDGTTTNRSTPVDVLHEQIAQPSTLNAAFSWSPDAAHEGSPSQFTDLSSSQPDPIQSWLWDFGGFGTSGSQHPSFTFPDSGLHNVCLTVATASVDASYSSLEFTRNSPYPDVGTTPWPKGDVTLGGVPFRIPQTDPVIWNTHDPYLAGPNPRTLDIALNQPNAQRVYALINTFGGQPGPAAHAWLEFWGDDGAYYRKDLVGNTDIRDYNFDGWTNGINGTTTVNVFMHNPGVYNGERRLDMQIIDLPPAFYSQMLTQIRLSDNGDGNFQRVFLVGMTVETQGNSSVPGAADEVCQNVSINNVAPTATFAVMDTVYAGQPARLEFSNPFDPSSIDTAAGLLYSYDCTNDGIFEQVDSETPFYECVYPAVGSVTSRGRIKDKDGGSTEYTSVVEVMPHFTIVTESPLPSGIVGQPYSVVLQAAGGTLPYKWSIAAGSLPPGLSLNEDSGEISGTPTAAGTYGFTVQVTDNSMGVATKPFGLAPPPPSGAAGSQYEVPVTIDPAPGSGGTDPGVCTNYSVTSGMLPSGLVLDPNTGLVSGTPINGGTYQFTIGCTVNGGQNNGQIATKEFTITIYNPAPAITSLDPASATEGGVAFLLTVNGVNFVTASTVHWNGASRPTTYMSATQVRAEISGADIAAVGTASVTVVNPEPGGGVSAPAGFTINPANRPPTVDAGGPYNVFEGGAVELVASGFDPEGGPLIYAWDLDNNGDFEAAGQTVSFSAANLDGPGSHTVTVVVTDSGSLTAKHSVVVTVVNVAPTVGAVSAPIDPVAVNGVVSANASFTDPGVFDTHTAVWDWGDGASSAGNVVESNGSGAVSGSHSYAAAGIYTVKVTVADDDGDSGVAVFSYVVVYDPSAGFVTGGGWIDSPVGAYTPEPSLTGRANFGFVAKYQKGAHVPTGETQFQFRVANLNFQSVSYEWLVVAGAKAQYKGTGTINGSGSYGFMLTAIDGAINGGGGSDKFRIKIWDKNNSDVIVYDNKMGESDDSSAATVIGGGSIVIHKGE